MALRGGGEDVLWVRLEGDFGGALRALDVEAEDLRSWNQPPALRAQTRHGRTHLNPIVLLPIHRLFPRIELLPLVDILPTSPTKHQHQLPPLQHSASDLPATHRERRHETNDLLPVLAHLPPRDEARVKVGREVLVEHFTFRHGGRWSGGR